MRRVFAAIVFLVLAVPRGYAQQPAAVPESPGVNRPPSAAPTPAPLRAAVKSLRFDDPSAGTPLRGDAPAPSRARAGTGERVVLTAAAGVAGFFTGGFLGAKIDGDCGGCDDPGFMGAIIGAPIGAAAAAIAIWIWSGKD